MPIEVHKLSQDPTAAWKAISTEKAQRVIKIAMRSPNAEIPENKVRIVCMSGKKSDEFVNHYGGTLHNFIGLTTDTHSLTPYIKFDIPDGDIFIHAGDFTKCGKMEEVSEFNNWIGK